LKQELEMIKKDQLGNNGCSYILDKIKIGLLTGISD